MPWPIGEQTQGSYNWLRRELGAAFKFSADYAEWNYEQAGIVDSCIVSGTSRFFFPPPMGEDARHEWSFLMPTKTLATVNGTSSYALPDDFTGGLEYFTFSSNAKIPIIKESDLRAMQTKEGASNAAPKFAAIRPIPIEGATTQKWEVEFYPTPDSAYTLSYAYQINPEPLSKDNQTAMGGREHAETMLESCLAVAQSRFGLESPVNHMESFTTRLMASIALDTRLKSNTGGPWEITEPTYGTYPYFLRAVGGYLGFTYNPDNWSYDQDRLANMLTQNGIRWFYNPPVGKDAMVYEWSFLKPTATLSLTSGDYDYDLPADFGTIADDVTLALDDGSQKIQIISESQIRAKRASADASGQPKYAAVRPKAIDYTAEQSYEMIFYPTPDESFTATYVYNVSPADATTTNLYPLGTKVHGETILAACLANAEVHKHGQRGAQYDNFQDRLAASIAIDRRATGMLRPSETVRGVA